MTSTQRSTHRPRSRRPRPGAERRAWLRAWAGVALTAAAAVTAAAPSAGAVAAGPVRAAQGAHRLYLPAVDNAGAVAAVRPGVGSGYFEEPFGLELTSATPGARIRYTADGSEPTESHGLDYRGAVPILRTTVIRARAYRAGRVPSPVATHTYISIDEVLAQSNDAARDREFPLTWGRYPDDWVLAGAYVPAQYGMDPGVVAEYRQGVRAALVALPTLSLVTTVADMFGPDGVYANPMVEGLERPAHAELLPFAGEPGFAIDCGVRIAGGHSRRPDVMAKHSFSLRFRGDYGSPRLRYDLFPGSGVTSFDVLRLRGGQADSFPFFADKAQYVHDEWARATQRAMGSISAHGRFVQLFVDGLYWGVYNLTEEPTAAFAESHLGGTEEQWDVVKDGHAVDGRWQPEVEDGSMEAYDRMLAIASTRADPADPAAQARYRELAALLDLEQHADYTLLQIYGANYDWPAKNYRAARNRVVEDGFRFLIWDYEHTTALRDDPSRGFCLPRTDPRTGECGFNADTAGVGGLHGWLKAFPDYRTLFADRVQAHLLDDGGALTPAEATERYSALVAAVEPAIAAEAARWGTGRAAPLAEVDQAVVWRDYRSRRGRVAQTPTMWREEARRVLTAFFPSRTDQVLGQLCREGLYPTVHAPVLSVEDTPGRGHRVSISSASRGCPGGGPGGVVYVTTDGTDPRAPGGAVADGAMPYAGPFRVKGLAMVRARAASGDGTHPRWSTLAQADFGVPNLAVSEIMYHPVGEPAAEFVELQNLEAMAVDVSGFRIAEAVTFTFPAGTLLEPNGHVVVAEDADAFDARYPGVPIAGTYAGRLANSAETIVVLAPDGGPIMETRYRDDGLWPRSPDGHGYSLVPIDAAADNLDAESWRASARVGGSPGRADPVPPHGTGRLVVSEVLAHPSERQDLAVEVHNPSTEALDVGGWLLADDLDQPSGYRFPAGTTVPPGGYAVVYGPSLATDGPELAATGGTVFVVSAGADGRPTGHMLGLDYLAAEVGLSSGRAATTAGARVTLLAATTFGEDDAESAEAFRAGRGAPNAAPPIGDVVIDEIMYHPADGAPEWVELVNRSDYPVELHAPGDAARTWQVDDAVRYRFPPGIALPAGGRALVAEVPPEEFRTAVPVPDGVGVFGPFEGRLDNAGERVALVRPWPGSAGGPDDASIVVDAVTYGDRSPWPPAADGAGPSLERRAPWLYGDEPASWSALHRGGTPGLANTLPRAAYLPLVLAVR